MINLEPEFLKFLNDSRKELENASALAVKLYLAFEAGYNHRKRNDMLKILEIKTVRYCANCRHVWEGDHFYKCPRIKKTVSALDTCPLFESKKK